MPTLRQLLDDAIPAVARLKHPNINDFREEMNRVLEAASMLSIGRQDLVRDITESHGTVIIETCYSIRQCEQTETISIPVDIIDAEDPVKAATLWGLRKRIEASQDLLAQARKLVTKHQMIVADLEAQLQAISG